MDNTNIENKATDEKLIVSKDRVKEHGEVYTPSHIVKDMCDLVKDESYDITKTFLEPACGNGNFLVELIDRKMQGAKAVTTQFDDLTEFHRNMFQGVASIYGVDILPDNVADSRTRMINIITEKYREFTGAEKLPIQIKNVVSKILEYNIILGNTLTNEQFKLNVETFDRGPRKGEQKIEVARDACGMPLVDRNITFIEWEFNTDGNVKCTESYIKPSDEIVGTQTFDSWRDLKKLEYTEASKISVADTDIL